MFKTEALIKWRMKWVDENRQSNKNEEIGREKKNHAQLEIFKCEKHQREEKYEIYKLIMIKETGKDVKKEDQD